MALWWRNGGIAATQSGVIWCGSCPCEGEQPPTPSPCPTNNCVGCPSYNVTIAGFTGDCATCNITASISRSIYCEWAGFGFGSVGGFCSVQISLSCVGGYWVLTVAIDTGMHRASYSGSRANTTGCPPTGVWSLSQTSGDCTGTVTATLS